MLCRARTLVLPAILLLAGACAPGGAMDTSPFRDTAGPAHCEVQNNHRSDMRVYALRYGEAERLGTVTSHTRTSFELPRAWVDQGVPIAIRVEAIGGTGRFTTERHVLEPGSVLELTVQDFLPQSVVTIR